MPEDIALFIDFENIRYSMLNIQRREPDPQELIAVARRYGTVMVARAYADWSRQAARPYSYGNGSLPFRQYPDRRSWFFWTGDRTGNGSLYAPMAVRPSQS